MLVVIDEVLLGFLVGATELAVAVLLLLLLLNLELKLLVPMVENTGEKAADQDHEATVDGRKDPQQVSNIVLALRPSHSLVDAAAYLTDDFGDVLGAHEYNDVDDEEHQRGQVGSEQRESNVVLLHYESDDKHADNDTTERDLHDVKHLNRSKKVEGLKDSDQDDSYDEWEAAAAPMAVPVFRLVYAHLTLIGRV